MKASWKEQFKTYLKSNYEDQEEYDLDDILIHHTSIQLEKEQLKYLLFEFSKKVSENQYQRVFKAIKLVKIKRVPKKDLGLSSYLNMQKGVLSGFYMNQINYIQIMANITKPTKHGLIYAYGVQGMSGNSFEDAMHEADVQMAAVERAISGTFRTMEYVPLTSMEARWVFEKLTSMADMRIIRGVPGAKNDSGRVSTQYFSAGPSDVEEQTEEFLIGMDDYEYLFVLTATCVDPAVLSRWKEAFLKEETFYASIRQGQKSMTFGLSMPMTFASNMGASQGWNTSNGASYGQGYADSVSHTEGTSHSQGISTSWSDSHGLSYTKSQGTSDSYSQGISQSQSASASRTIGLGDGISTNKGIGMNIGAGRNVSLNEGYNMGSNQSFGHSTNDGTSTSHAVNQAFNTSNSFSNSIGTSNSQSWSQNAGISGGQNWSNSSSHSSGSSFNAGLNHSTSTGNAESFGINGSADIGLVGVGGNYGNTQSNGTSDGFSAGLSASTSNSNSSSMGGSSGWSQGQGYSHGISNSTSHGTGTSTGFSNGVSNGTGTSHSYGMSSSYGTSMGSSIGKGIGTSLSSGFSASEGAGISSSLSKGWSAGTGVSTGQTFGTSHGISNSESFGRSQSHSVGGGTSESFGTTSSESVGHTENVSRSQNVGTGTSGGVSNGISAGMGLGPSLSFGRSFAWEDREASHLVELLDYSVQRIIAASNNLGMWFTDIYVATESEEAANAATQVAMSAWHDPSVATCPLQVYIPSEQEKKYLFKHMSVFSPSTIKEGIPGQFESYKYSTMLLSSELNAYSHPPRVNVGGIQAAVDDPPVLTIPSDRQNGDIFLGYVANTESYSLNRGYRSDFKYSLSNDELHHAYISGASRSGKTVAALRLVAEAYKNVRRGEKKKRLRFLIMDPKQDWRCLAKVVPEDHFRFYSLSNPQFHMVKMNLMRIPHGVYTERYADKLREIFIRSYGLGDRGFQILGQAINTVYKKAGCYEEDVMYNQPDEHGLCPATERSKQVTLEDVCKQLQQDIETETARDKKEAIQRILDRMTTFQEPLSTVYKVFCNRGEEGMGIDGLLGADDVIVLESYGMDTKTSNFIFGLITSGVYQYAVSNGGFVNPEDQYETVLVIEEANQVLISEDEDNLGGANPFEIILDQSAGYGLFIWCLTQKISDMPRSVLANSSLKLIGRQDDEEDIKKSIVQIGKDGLIADRVFKNWLPDQPIGWFIIKSSRNRDFTKNAPVHVFIEYMNVKPPTDEELDQILKMSSVKQQQEKILTSRSETQTGDAYIQEILKQ